MLEQEWRSPHGLRHFFFYKLEAHMILHRYEEALRALEYLRAQPCRVVALSMLPLSTSDPTHLCSDVS